MGKKTALLNWDEVQRAIDDLVDTAALRPRYTPTGLYLRLLVDMATAYQATLPKTKKPRATSKRAKLRAPLPKPPKPKPKAKKAKPKRRARA